jgi:hypothetical protein
MSPGRGLTLAEAENAFAKPAAGPSVLAAWMACANFLYRLALGTPGGRQRRAAGLTRRAVACARGSGAW